MLDLSRWTITELRDSADTVRARFMFLHADAADLRLLNALENEIAARHGWKAPHSK
jgi:hypothetical protein